MNWFSRLLGSASAGPSAAASEPDYFNGPRAGVSGTMISINTPEELEQALRLGNMSNSGVPVNECTALKVATVFACLRIRTGAVANTPLGIKRKVDERTRVDASDHEAWKLLCRRPNKWQTPQQFKRMMEAHVLLRGNAHAVKVRGVGGKVIALIPLHPDRVKRAQLDSGELAFTYTRKDGRQFVYPQEDMFYLTGLSLDGVNGLSVLHFARETIGGMLAMENHGNTVFRNGANVSAAFKLPAGKALTNEQKDYLRAQLDEYRAGGAREGKAIVLEDGLEYEQMALTSKDLQWLQGREFGRTDVCMFFGVQPHMIGITAGNTQLGSSIDGQTQNFVTFSLEDSFIAWEEAIGLQLLKWDVFTALYARFNRNALVRADFKTRWEGYVKAMQWGVFSPNKVLAKEDENPRPGGDVYYDPPNTAGTSNKDNSNVAP
ncbi:HK97 family phage portal protein [Novosphingobium sp. SG751A]|uniref:phage portal protein n=1 Tax=Novosphingobium sp. SG751A TaxID=2587000 RepID=UPI001552C473|nr:phage portal protein [Novosphingobium sp. SG751A]NOW44095.1 HK97 family phage portal protein [Novosphingobium sp. SG751A]